MSNFQIMSAVTATYKPQSGQSFRCSIDIPGWNTPSGGQLMFTVIVPPGYPQPVFSVTHDKKGKDDTWYTNISNNVTIPVDSGNGGPGANGIYLGTTSQLPSGLDGNMQYAVVIWISYP